MGNPWTEEEKKVVVEMYADYFAEEIAEILGRPKSGIYRQAHLMGLRSSREKIARSGRMTAEKPSSKAHRFQNGHTPANKGKKMDAELYDRLKPSMYQKGHVPTNYRPIGSERVNRDGYIEVKVADPGIWKLKHRVVWEKAHGEIPVGCNVQFKNGNSQDVRLENLYLISRADQLGKENGMYVKYPEELRAVMRLKGSINRQINKYKKRQQEHGKES